MISFVNFVSFLTPEAQSFQDCLKEIIKECNELVSNGAREITFTGDKIVNAYSHQNEKLSDLIKKNFKYKRSKKD